MAQAASSGPLFRSLNRYIQPRRLSGIDVARVTKKLAAPAGLDAAKYAGQSLRAGHATSAAIAGASERSIMKQTGHRSAQMVGGTSETGACSGTIVKASWACKAVEKPLWWNEF